MSQRAGGWDEPSDRRGRYSGRRDHDYDRQTDRDRDSDRNRRNNRDGDRDRRYRSRSRERRDRDRDRPRDDRDHGGDRRRDFGRDRDRRRDDDRRRREEDGERLPRRRNDEDENVRPRDREPRRSASPGRPGTASSPPRRLDPRHTDTLPTRSRGGEQPTRKEQSTMSFKVGDRRGSERGTPMADDTSDGGSLRDKDEERGEDDDNIEVEEDDDTAAMQAMMGFGGFGSTKGQKIAGNNLGGVRKEKKLEYRQYMNRQGGFNRPLSPSR